MLLFLILLPAPAGLGQQEPVFRAGVAAVKVDVQVAEPGGRAIADLGAEDFQVLDNGQPQKIAFFGRESEPLDLLLLLDVSGSVRRQLQEVAATARAALKALHAGDRAGVMLFARETAMTAELSPDFELPGGIRDASLGGGTEIYASIIAAAQYMRKQPVRGRRAVLVMTDNLTLNYRITDDDVIRALYDADTVLNAILIGKQKRPDAPKPGGYINPDFTPSDVFKLAEQTGGEAMESPRVRDSLPLMIERIRSRYHIQYNAPPSEPGVFHRVRVELAPPAHSRHPRAVVRARAGYYATVK